MQSTIQTYFNAFNAGDIEGMLECLDDTIAHHVNEGQVRMGKDAFRSFCLHMNQCYSENLTDMVLFSNLDESRAAAEYTVNGTYLKTDAGLPEAHSQKYKLPAGSFFSLSNNKITRVVTYYNLADWTAQVS
jgi:steroid delta-isomerase-like uncharacterized protein